MVVLITDERRALDEAHVGLQNALIFLYAVLSRPHLRKELSTGFLGEEADLAVGIFNEGLPLVFEGRLPLEERVFLLGGVGLVTHCVYYS